MRIDAAIIGGTGIGERLRALGGIPTHVPTSRGCVRTQILDVDGHSVALLSRHSAGHKVPPHKVNYLAMAEAVKQLGASVCFATAAVGSLREDWPGGTMAVATDFFDLSARNTTAFDRTVAHTDFSDPFPACPALRTAAEVVGIPVKPSAVYLNGPGPRYETPFEIQLYKRIGGDVVGMTAGSEAIAMREYGVDYACLCVVTNLAAGISITPLSHEEVVEEMERSGEKAIRILMEAVKNVRAKV